MDIRTSISTRTCSTTSLLVERKMENAAVRKRQSSIEDHGFIATSILRLKLSKTSFNRIDLCSYLPLSSIRVGTNVLTSSRLFLILDFLALIIVVLI